MTVIELLARSAEDGHDVADDGTRSGTLPLPYDVTAHLHTAHGRGVMDLPADPTHHEALHRWEHVEAGLGLVSVSHDHLVAAPVRSVPPRSLQGRGAA